MPPTIRLAIRAGFTDHPEGWKTHAAPTPCLGGLAVLLAVVAGVLVAGTVRGCGRFSWPPVPSSSLAWSTIAST